MTSGHAWARSLGMMLAALLLGIGGGLFIIRQDRSPAPIVGSVGAFEASYARWRAEVERTGQENTLVLSLGYFKGLSSQFSSARGRAMLDLATGALLVEATGLPEGDAFDVWLVHTRPARRRSVKPESGDRMILAGSLARSGGNAKLYTALDRKSLVGFKLDFLVIAQHGRSPVEHGLLYTTPNVFQRLYYADIPGRHVVSTRLGEPGPATDASSRVVASLRSLVPAPAFADASGSGSVADLIARGEKLFFEETFNGNGRTCGTCHPDDNNFTLDAAYIAGLDPDDPLFVAESQPALNADQNGGRHFEVPQLMRQFGLILENVDGFEDLTSKFVLRGVPHVFALGLTIAPAPTIFDGTSGKADRVGWSGDGAPGTGTLREFAIGAITQHLTRTLDRVPGVDFRLPTDDELDAIEAFLLSLGRPADLDLSSLVLKDPDAKAGLALFNGSGRCSICHLNAGAMIGVTIPSLGLVTGTQNANFDTGVEDAAHPAGPHGPLRPRDGGFGTDPNPLGGFGNGTFNTPSLVEAASSPPFFHNNLTDTIEGAVAFYSTPSFNLSPAALFFLGPINLLDDQTNQVAAFLRVINALEKIRSAQARLSSTLGLWDPTQAGGLLQLTIIDLNQAVRVLQDAPPSALRNGGLHPDAQADLGKAIASCNAGSQTGYQTKRDPSIKLALGYLDQARRDMLVLPPLRSNSLRPL